VSIYLPDGVRDSDPRAPWNQPESHCPICVLCRVGRYEEHVECPAEDSHEACGKHYEPDPHCGACDGCAEDARCNPDDHEICEECNLQEEDIPR